MIYFLPLIYLVARVGPVLAMLMFMGGLAALWGLAFLLTPKEKRYEFTFANVIGSLLLAAAFAGWVTCAASSTGHRDIDEFEQDNRCPPVCN